ncbi:CDP-alcohol phosphatidyltransferase family protein [Actinoplanes sp. URMC 104]|uniref:CDP-alcohol phosphatidyltransferase family protein n=1 Tax=Actinoplanes sp. URMC 104 TaxID=3423409 RepID=UPI003F19E502
MHSYPLAVVRARTYRSLDAWWTVLLADPLASRLVWRAQPYRWITPDRLGGLAAALAVAAALCFAVGGRGWLVAGALLFHLGFVAGRTRAGLTRLRGGGTVLGGWYDFMADRLRAVLCAAALLGGQYAQTGRPLHLWLAVWVVGLDLLRYLNAAQMAGIRARLPRPVPAARGVGAVLRAHRIRTHLVSGVEFEMAVFVLAPLTGWIAGAVVTAGVLLILFEVRLVLDVCREARRPAVAGVPEPRVVLVPSISR